MGDVVFLMGKLRGSGFFKLHQLISAAQDRDADAGAELGTHSDL